MELIANGYGVSLWDDENILELVLIVTPSCEYTKNQLTVFECLRVMQKQK